MNNSIIFNEADRKFIVSPQILEIIKNLSKKDTSYKNERKELTTEFDSFDFGIRMNNILSSAIIDLEYLPDEDNEISFDVTRLKSLVQKFEELYPKNKREDNYHYHFENLDNDVVADLLVVINGIENERNQFYLIRDLINAKNDCVENMKYFLDNYTISNWINEYDNAVNSRDINKMKSMISQIQNMILQEWSNYFQNLESMNDDNFCFIGHSTHSTEFEDEFYSDYVSTSVYTPDLTDTYRGGYGFVFAPKNIVGASSKDMYVNNYVNNDESILSYSSVSKIDHPKRVILETKKQKEENLANGSDKKTYNEVVFNTFEPIGIFCFTDGSKGFNWNQIYAEKLKEYFPDLKIYSFDVLKHKKGNDLIEAKLKLLNSIQKRVNPNGYDINEDMLDRFDYFFAQFEKLKQTGEYDENMISSIFDHNRKMISTFDTNPEDLFNGQFNEQDIEYILRKNYRYNLDDILARKSRAFVLNNLKQLLPYKEKVSEIFEGLDVLIDLLQRIDVTDEMMAEINSLDSLNLLTISKHLANKLIGEVNSQEEVIKTNLTGYEVEYKELVTEYQKRTELEEQYQYYSEIDSNKFFFDMVKIDYQELMEEINKENLEGMELELKLQKLVSEVEKLNALNLENSKKEYESSQTHFDYEKALEEINLNVNTLSKHPILNRKKIKEEKKKLKYFTSKDREEKIKFDSDKETTNQNTESQLRDLDFDIENTKILLDYSKERIKRLNEQLITMQENIKSHFKCESIEEIESKIKESEQFIQHYDRYNSFRLMELQRKIEQLNNMIIQQQESLEEIQEEKEIISRGM